MNLAPRGFRQPRCPRCGLTAIACVCALFGTLQSRVSVSVVMSSAEARSASNSARLLSLWLPNVELHVRGGAAAPASAGAASSGQAPSPAGAERSSGLVNVTDPEPLLLRPGTALLFPGGGRSAPLPSDVQHLIVPDGTWAQARRIERRWFAPHGLPRVELEGPWPSLYELRRGRQGVCTFEATAIALGLLDDPGLAEALLSRFACWAERARWLKAGGALPHAPAAQTLVAAAHPAVELLRQLPAGSANAADALLGRVHSPAPGTDE